MAHKFWMAVISVVVSVGMASILTVSTMYAEEGSPAGNNGTIKIGEALVEGEEESNANDPHIAGCSLSVRFFGYDVGPRSATVTFESQAPTLNTLVSPIGAQNFNFTGGGPGDQQDGIATYTLAFQGEPQPEQGYHVKVTVNADGSQGSDKKSKVFWVEGCTNEEEKLPNIAVVGVCVPAEQVVRLTFTNSGEGVSNISVNSAASTVAAGATVNVTTPITGATVSVDVVIDGKQQTVTVTCPSGGSGSVVTPQGNGGQVAVTPAVVRGGSGAAEVVSLPVTSGGGEQVGALAALVSTVSAAAGAYLLRTRQSGLL